MSEEDIRNAFAVLGADYWFAKCQALEAELEQVKRDHMADVRYLNKAAKAQEPPQEGE